jgi:electron transport complex protein RnfG
MNAPIVAKSTLKTALNMVLFAVVGTAILAFTFMQTHALILKSEEAEKLKLITQIVSPDLFDNDIVKDTLEIPASAQLGTDEPGIVYRARLQGKPSVVVLQAIAPDGYSGKIGLIVAIREDATVAGVRVVSHKETPGLGDYIDYAKNHWISVFDGASHARYKEDNWKVKKDGGQFDYMAGATITPRAVVKAVHKALHYYEENREKLFAAGAAQPPATGERS